MRVFARSVNSHSSTIQYTNVTDRPTGQTGQRSNSIGRTVLQTVAQKSTTARAIDDDRIDFPDVYVGWMYDANSDRWDQWVRHTDRLTGHIYTIIWAVRMPDLCGAAVSKVKIYIIYAWL